MKVSLHWLRRFVDFDLTATELAEKLTMRGIESEVVSDFDSLENLVVGDVLTAKSIQMQTNLNYVLFQMDQRL